MPLAALIKPNRHTVMPADSAGGCLARHLCSVRHVMIGS
jgi:hypothetical protein